MRKCTLKKHARIQKGEGTGVWTSPENQKNIGSLNYTGLDHMKSIQCWAIIGTPLIDCFDYLNLLHVSTLYVPTNVIGECHIHIHKV